MKFDRLLSILLLLQQRQLVPATELARRLEVSVRTVYRDVEALSAAGIPVYAERGRHGGVRLVPGFRTDMTGLTRDEARALFVLVGQSAHSALGLDRALGSALRKMMSALPAPHRSAAELTSRRLLIDPDGWLGGQRDQTGLDELHDAVLADRRLRIAYRHSGRATVDVYCVDPYGLVSKAGTWYLVADHEGRPRLFRADRLRGVTVTTEPARRRDGVELVDVWEELRRRVESRGKGTVVRARVRRRRLDMLRRITRPHFLGVAGEGAPDAEELMTGGNPPPGSDLPTGAGPGTRAEPAGGPARTAEGRDGRGDDRRDGRGEEGRDGAADGDTWLTVELEYPVPAAVRQLLQFGTDVEVLGPPEALREISRAATDLAALYSRTG
ncbi:MULTISPECIES: helix-turn-helix transcriptional regulator [Streptomyces]|uniref:DNA-binding transcriptional regulator n=2 Tax=Streptomyces TaxID=1883 RepID=A0A117IWP8_9ACTN|nr:MULTISPECIES: WYL domain-containing protein [Streptomyces]KUH39563.1 DNA-binding transcriptional regulator [Streptomyces kanasensis]UUS34108.1 WYL domain-containing protein [Streptomyces changanensis]